MTFKIIYRCNNGRRSILIVADTFDKALKYANEHFDWVRIIFEGSEKNLSLEKNSSSTLCS